MVRKGVPQPPDRLKGNAVKIGNSSLCCEFLPPEMAQQVLTIFCHWPQSGREGVSTGTSQKTCLCNDFTIQGNGS